MSNFVRVISCTSLTEPTYTTAAFRRTASMKLRMLAAATWLVSADRQQAYQDKRTRYEPLSVHTTSITCYPIRPYNVETVSVIGVIILAALCSAASRTWLPSRVRFSAALCLPFVPSVFPPIYLVLRSIPYCLYPIPIGS